MSELCTLKLITHEPVSKRHSRNTMSAFIVSLSTISALSLSPRTTLTSGWTARMVSALS
jgi:hypothetical protein